MTITPDDQEWLALAEEAFGGDGPPDETGQDDSEQPHWRYRSPVV